MIGPPGSGKTTFCQRLMRLTDVDVQFCRQNPGKAGILKRVFAFLRCPIFSIMCYGFVLSRAGVKRRDILMVYVVQSRFLRTRSDDSFFVVDEGPVHALFSIMYGTRPNFVSNLFLKAILNLMARRVSRYIYFDPGPSQRLDNVCRRSQETSRFNSSMSERQREEFFRDQTYSQIMASLKAICPDKISYAAGVNEAVTEWCSNFARSPSYD